MKNLVFVFAVMVFFTSWQTYDIRTDHLVVHTNDDPNSEIYFEGKPEDYDGCVSGVCKPSNKYKEKQALLRELAKEAARNQ